MTNGISAIPQIIGHWGLVIPSAKLLLRRSVCRHNRHSA